MGRKRESSETSPLLYIVTGAILYLGWKHFNLEKKADITEGHTNDLFGQFHDMYGDVGELMERLDELEEAFKKLEDHVVNINKLPEDLDKRINDAVKSVNKAREEFKNIQTLVVTKEDFDKVLTDIGKLQDEYGDLKREVSKQNNESRQ